MPQVKLDDVSGESTAVVEGSVVDHVSGADPVVGKLVRVGKTA